MIMQTHTRPVGKKFMELFRHFPIRPIRSEAEYDQAAAVLDGLAVCEEGSLSQDEQDYLDALTLVVSAYDQEHGQVDTSHVTPRRLIRFLMDQREMTPTDLGRVLGSKSAASFLLSGERTPSPAQCYKLGRYFAIDPGAFLADPSKRRARRASMPKRANSARSLGE